ncbi:MAG: extracellular solute-binding protein, partial [Candidatus Carbobacillus sp.]|nr:extracellular solute-binding protein [Candidatus Carbobacillus sp.]
MLHRTSMFGAFRYVWPLFFVVLIALSLSGCGQSAVSNDAPSGATNTDPVATTNAPEATETNTEEPIVHVYTARHYDADEALFADFTKETGIEVKIISGKAEELMERIAREGAHTEADVFITVDGGVLNLAKERQLIEPITDDVILSHVPSDRRDRDNAWVGLSTRARVIVYDKTRNRAEDFSTYEALTEEAWHKKLLVRSSTSLYNQSLLASFIALHGRDQAKAWAEGIVTNFARQPEGNDRDQMKALVQGVGDAAIVNTYYVGLLLNSEDAEERAVGERIGVFFPDQETTGTHI